MTEITRVPLQPIARGALARLWIGVTLAVALGGAAAWVTRQQGMQFETIKAGSGPSPTIGDYVLIKLVGKLGSGKEFEKDERLPLPVQGTLPGFQQALVKMQKGGKYHVFIPARLAYGANEQRNPQTGEVTIPAYSDLNFDIDLIDFRSAADVMRQRAIMQQLQQMQGGGAPAGGREGMPGGAGAAPSAP